MQVVRLKNDLRQNQLCVIGNAEELTGQDAGEKEIQPSGMTTGATRRNRVCIGR